MEMPQPDFNVTKTTAVGKSEPVGMNEAFLRARNQWVPPKPVVEQHFDKHKQNRSGALTMNALSFSMKHYYNFNKGKHHD